ncbi:hypothetical protein LCGC14_2743710, partial [marine sediment metagenome]
FSFDLQKESNIFYRYKYVIQFTSKYPYLIRIIQILKIWNENRKIRLSETILELLAIEATFRTNSPDPLEIEILKGKEFAFFLRELNTNLFKEKIYEIYNMWLKNPDKFIQLKKLAKEYAFQNYSVSQEILMFKDLIDKIDRNNA